MCLASHRNYCYASPEVMALLDSGSEGKLEELAKSIAANRPIKAGAAPPAETVQKQKKGCPDGPQEGHFL